MRSQHGRAASPQPAHHGPGPRRVGKLGLGLLGFVLKSEPISLTEDGGIVCGMVFCETLFEHKILNPEAIPSMGLHVVPIFYEPEKERNSM